MIEVIIKHWDGGAFRGESILRGKAGERAELIQRVVQLVEEIAQEKQRGQIDPNVREDIAVAIFQRALGRKVKTIEPKMKDASRHTQQWLRLWRQTQRLLSIAAFFDPSQEEIRRELLIETTRDDVSYATLPHNHNLSRLRQRSLVWAKYCDTFGLAFEYERFDKFGHRGGRTDNRTRYTSFALQYLVTSEDILKSVSKELHSSETRRQTDIPEAVLQQWQTELTADYLKRLRLVVERHERKMQPFARTWLRNLKSFDTTASKAEFLELLWPLLIKDKLFNGIEYERSVEEIYGKLGKPDSRQRR